MAAGESKMKKAICSLILLLSSLPSVIWCASGLQEQPLTLDKAIAIALRSHPRLQAVAYEAAAAEARVQQARSSSYPQIDAGGLIKEGLGGAAAAFGLDGIAGSPFPNGAAASANIIQNLFDSGRTKHQTEARAFEAGEISEKAQEERAKIVLSVKNAFFEGLKTEKLALLARKNRQMEQLTLRQAKAFASAGLKSGLEVELVRVELSKKEAELVKADNRQREAQASLRNAMGVSESRIPYRLAASPVILSAPGHLDALLAQALADRPELRGIQARIKADQAWLEFAHSEMKPKFMAAFSAGMARFAQLSLRNLLFGGISFQLPIFDGKRLQGKVDEVEAILEKNKALEQELKQDIRMEVESAFIRMLNAVEAARAHEQVAAHAREAIRLARLRYESDLGDLVELTRAETTLVESEVNYTEALLNFKRAEASLQYAHGQGLQ